MNEGELFQLRLFGQNLAIWNFLAYLDLFHICDHYFLVCLRIVRFIFFFAFHCRHSCLKAVSVWPSQNGEMRHVRKWIMITTKYGSRWRNTSIQTGNQMRKRKQASVENLKKIWLREEGRRKNNVWRPEERFCG